MLPPSNPFPLLLESHLSLYTPHQYNHLAGAQLDLEVSKSHRRVEDYLELDRSPFVGFLLLKINLVEATTHLQWASPGEPYLWCPCVAS